MIRIAFIMYLNENWLGGINYFRNLLCAISENANSKIVPVVFVGKKSNKKLLKGFPDIEIIESNMLDAWSFSWIGRKIENKLLFKDRLMDNLLKHYKIDIVSHLTGLAGEIKTPLLGWIPDFQHRHLPHLFSEKELEYRDQSFKKICNLSNGIIVSSYDAKYDLQVFDPNCKSKAHVLQFVVQPPSSDEELSIQELEYFYGFRGKYMYVPNQFWVHKNHRVLLEALKILKQQERKILIISTGNTEDYRNLQYYEELSAFIKEHNLLDSFIILGKVPYSHVVSLAKNCMTLINPSLFEGWSTTVEEAKSLGKKIILSDIPVHREQNPSGGIFFDPYNSLELAEVLYNAWQSNESEDLLKIEADKALRQRWEKFAKTYEKIILDTLK